ncbi:MAG TPA: BsuPI-related putative proteinase inhibitor [Steroidobacteraceae bacterium]|nr:BsuPI-related putative proteinase inhibitor [Steroidobacteraceae bacterium]
MSVAKFSSLMKVAGLFLMATGLQSCGGGSSSGGGSSAAAGFDVELEMRANNGAPSSSFAFGNNIVFALIVTNRSGAAQILSLPSTQIYDLAVLPEGSATPRWRWSFNRVFQPTETNLTFAGHQTITYLYIWPGVLEDGTQIMPGSFDVRATLAYPNYAADWRASDELAAPIRKLTITN